MNYHLRPLRFFASIGRPLERYFTEVIRAQGDTVEADLWMEAEERLGQLDFLIDEITELQHQVLDLKRQSHEAWRQNVEKNGEDNTRLFASPERAEADRLSALGDEGQFKLKLTAEAFYYFAARLLSILQYFPHLKNLDAVGIRNVRNHLVEHPEKGASGVTQHNWSFGGEDGPAFKNIRRPDQDHVPIDRGLFINAAELRENLERKLRVVIEAILPVT